jgi:hypothetical protein
VPRSTLLGLLLWFSIFFVIESTQKGRFYALFFVCQFWRELVLVLRGSTRPKWRTNVSNK